MRRATRPEPPGNHVRDDQDACTVDTLVGSADQCNAECSFSAITQCVNGDAVVPGCDSSTDDDCAPTETPTRDDQDGDGFGVSAEGCAHTEIDCDDAQQDVHPGAAEVCNNLDDNCDGQVDEGTNLKDDRSKLWCVGQCLRQRRGLHRRAVHRECLDVIAPGSRNAGSRSIIVVQARRRADMLSLPTASSLREHGPTMSGGELWDSEERR